MNYQIKFFLFSSLIIFLSSCSDITNEIWLDKNGGGKLQTSVDLAAFMPKDLMDKMKDEGSELGLDSLMQEEEPVEMIDEEEQKPSDPIEQLFGMMINDDGVLDLDTMITFHDMMPDSLKNRDTDEELFKRMSLHLKGDKSEGTAFTTFGMEFKDAEEANDLFKGLSESMKEAKPDSDDLFKSNSFMWSSEKGYVKLPALSMPDKLGDEAPDGMGKELEGLMGGSDNEEDKQMMEMMEAMLGQIVTIVHVPGTIEFTNDPKAEINGNTVTFRKPLLHMMNKDVRERVIKFKTK